MRYLTGTGRGDMEPTENPYISGGEAASQGIPGHLT